ncbi:MAG: electron transport complex subunit RsxE [Omnitrophica bacterium]|nr:electron transport complex subunit RsxE [Candidatus Omnitrophota bacterium]
MTKIYSLWGDFLKGLWKQNPVFKFLLGMCPALAVTNSVINGLTMGLAVIFVLLCSNIVVSLVRKAIPHQVRIAVFVVFIATFVTVVDLFLKAQFPQLSKALGPYVPLIVVNCIILGRAEAFASKNPLPRSLFDGLGMGLGFTLALLLLGAIREILGMGSLLGVEILGENFERWVIMVSPAGAFLTLGILIGIFNLVSGRKKAAGSSGPSCHTV